VAVIEAVGMMVWCGAMMKFVWAFF